MLASTRHLSEFSPNRLRDAKFQVEFERFGKSGNFSVSVFPGVPLFVAGSIKTWATSVSTTLAELVPPLSADAPCVFASPSTCV